MRTWTLYLYEQAYYWVQTDTGLWETSSLSERRIWTRLAANVRELWLRHNIYQEDGGKLRAGVPKRIKVMLDTYAWMFNCPLSQHHVEGGHTWVQMPR
jgi:hypothetical protein